MNNLEKAKTLFESALAAHATDDYSTARDRLTQALALAPDRVSILTNLSAVLIKLKQPDEALRHARRSIELEADNAEGWLNAATALHMLEQYDEALAHFDRALALAPDSAETWTNRGNTLHALGRDPEAIADFDRAIAINPSFAQAWMLRGMSLSDLGRPDQALASYDRALQLKPDYAEAWSNRGNSLHDLGRPDDALASYAHALSLDPDYAQAHFNEACCRLAIGDFANAWPKYHRRRQTENAAPIDIEDLPEWDGKPLSGTLLVKGEQGLGDQILYLGMLREARSRCAGVVVAVEPRLVSLVQRSFPDCRVISGKAPVPIRDCAAWVSLADMGRFFRNSWADFASHHTPWLMADPERSARIRQSLRSGRRLKCGISWVSKNNRFADFKSLALEQLLGVLRLPEIEFIDLQYGDTRLEREALLAHHGIAVTHLDGLDLTNDLEGLAALIAACDMVVTISNTTAHFAGALGKPMFLLLPYGQGRHWYWHHDRNDSPWYPTARLCRQPAPGEWEPAVRCVSQAIRAQFQIQ